LARELPEAVIVATALSIAALRLARHKDRLNEDDQQIHFVCSDMFTPISNSQRFVLVVSNPPYVSQAELSKLPREIRDHEPRYALDGGPDGLIAITRLIKEAPTILSRGGAVIMEMGADQAERVSGLVTDSQHYERHHIIKDYSGLDRVLVAIIR
jgi:release factor glutamine methyltransferase